MRPHAHAYGVVIFTTMKQGGFMLLSWYPEKKVFFDTVFAAHPNKSLADLKSLYYKDVSPDFLNTKYGIRGALVETINIHVTRKFMLSKNWLPKVWDWGCIFYEYQPTHIKIVYLNDPGDKTKSHYKKLSYEYYKALPEFMAKKNFKR